MGGEEKKKEEDVSKGKSKQLPWFSAKEVLTHNVAADCWVSYFDKVYDLTELIKKHKGLLTNPIVQFAGEDISHWFDPKTHEPITAIDENTNVEMYYLPYGRYVHIPPAEPTADWSTDFGTPWWADEKKYLVGRLSRRARKLRIVNCLSSQDDMLEVCVEETLEEIRRRYLRFNSHAESYCWKWLGRVLNMSKTLEENGVPDEADKFQKLDMDADQYVPALHVYFNDDLTRSS